jgi:heme-degrading monooxygenase HmoA
MEQENKYMLLVNWEKLEDHTEGFRKSDVYSKWRDLLHHYYVPFPTVEHYTPIVEYKKS